MIGPIGNIGGIDLTVIQQLREENLRLQKALGDMSVRASSLEQERDAARNQVNSLNVVIGDRDKEIADLRSQVQNLMGQTEQLNHELDMARRQYNAEQLQHAQTSQQLQAAQQTILDLNKQYEEERSRRHDLEQHVAYCNDTINELKRRLNVVEAEHQKKIDKLVAEHEAAMAQLQSEFDDAKAQMAAEKAQMIEEFELTKSQMQSEFDNAKAQMQSDFDGVKAQMQSDFEQAKTELQSQIDFVKKDAGAQSSLEQFIQTTNENLAKVQDNLRASGGGYSLGPIEMDLKVLPGMGGNAVSLPTLTDLKEVTNDHLSTIKVQFVPTGSKNPEEPTDGETPQALEVPNLHGMTTSYAKRTVESHGLTMETVYQLVPDSTLEGRVLDQQPVPYSQMPENGVLQVRIGKLAERAGDHYNPNPHYPHGMPSM